MKLLSRLRACLSQRRRTSCSAFGGKRSIRGAEPRHSNALREGDQRLRGVLRTAANPHDGSAGTLRDVLTTRNRKDQHGQASSLFSSWSLHIAKIERSQLRDDDLQRFRRWARGQGDGGGGLFEGELMRNQPPDIQFP